MRKLTPLSGGGDGGDVDDDVGRTSCCLRGSSSSTSALSWRTSSWNLSSPSPPGRTDLPRTFSGSISRGSDCPVPSRSAGGGGFAEDGELAPLSAAAIVSEPKRENMSSRMSRWNSRNTKQRIPEQSITGQPTVGLQSTLGTQSAVKIASENPG